METGLFVFRREGQLLPELAQVPRQVWVWRLSQERGMLYTCLLAIENGCSFLAETSNSAERYLTQEAPYSQTHDEA